MALSTSKCNRLTPLPFKGLNEYTTTTTILTSGVASVEKSSNHTLPADFSIGMVQ